MGSGPTQDLVPNRRSQKYAGMPQEEGPVLWQELCRPQDLTCQTEGPTPYTAQAQNPKSKALNPEPVKPAHATP